MATTPGTGRDDSDDHDVELDGVRALGTMLSRLDGRVGTLADLAGEGPLLVVVAERRCPTCRGAVRALASAGARLAVISQGRPEAAHDLVADAGYRDAEVLIEPSPHRVSEALGATTTPTFALFDGLEPIAWQDGWDREIVASLVGRAGGRLISDGGLGPSSPGCASRVVEDEAALAVLEEEDRTRPTTDDPDRAGPGRG